MNKNLLSVASLILMLSTAGCLSEEKEAEKQPQQANPRDALVKALDTQAISLVDSLNKVIINGSFIQNLIVNNKPEPIPLDNNNDVQKAVQYLLSNQSINGNISTYIPDSRFCSELIAVENPATCIEVTKRSLLVQTPSNATSGLVEFKVNGQHFFAFTYSESSIEVLVEASDVLTVLQIVSDLEEQTSGEGFREHLPTQASGSLGIAVLNSLTGGQVAVSVVQEINISGQDQESGLPFSVKIGQAQAALVLNLNSVMGFAAASFALPAVEIQAVYHDEFEQTYPAKISFPAATGGISIVNSMSQLGLQLQQLASNITVEVDGQQTAQLDLSSIDLTLTAHQGGHIQIESLDALVAQLDVTDSVMMEGNGSMTLEVEANTQLYHQFDAFEAKLVQGSIELSGTGDFAGSLNISANQCVQGTENSPQLLEITACTY